MEKKKFRGKDMMGETFGRLTVVKCMGVNRRHSYVWLCSCSCGNTTIVDGNCLRRGNTKSCGCLNHENHILRPNRRVHGQSGTRLYRIWKRMKSRCYNKNTEDYKKWYGSKGVKVCDEWKNDFQAFYDWAMANGYSEELTIDRIDPYGNYEPDNCRWADAKTQQSNKREKVG